MTLTYTEKELLLDTIKNGAEHKSIPFPRWPNEVTEK